MARSLSSRFMEDLRTGLLAELNAQVMCDHTLDFQIRSERIHIYYRGGKILDITPLAGGAGYRFGMDQNYSKGGIPVTLPSSDVCSKDNLSLWLDRIPQQKKSIDHYMGRKSSNVEREFQQLVSRENTYSTISNETDYFIVDIEFQKRLASGKDTKFDMVGLRWDSQTPLRKNPQKHKPRLAIFEMKYGDHALKGKAGLVDHLDKTLEFISADGELDDLKAEMIEVFRQKRDLGLVRFSKTGNPNEITSISGERPEFIFIIANHDPEKKALAGELDSSAFMDAHHRLSEKMDVLFAQAGFMGYGLYADMMLDLETFRSRLG